MLARKPERKKSFGRYKHKSEDNIKMYLKERYKV
jgi:hypothetical protein